MAATTTVEHDTRGLMMRLLRQRLAPDERILRPTWSIELVLLSFLVSWLGAFTSSQVLAQANTTRRTSRRLVWLSVAALTFGWQTVWSLHFLATLAETFDVDIQVDPTLTVLSAIVATGFTFAALTSDGVGSREGWLYTIRKSAVFKGGRRLVKRYRRQFAKSRADPRRASSVGAADTGRDPSLDGAGADDEDDEDDEFVDHARSAEEGLLRRTRDSLEDGATSSGDTPSAPASDLGAGSGALSGSQHLSAASGIRTAGYWDDDDASSSRDAALERGRKLLGDVPIDADTMRLAGLEEDADAADEAYEDESVPVIIKTAHSPRPRFERSRQGRQSPGVTFSTDTTESTPTSEGPPPSSSTGLASPAPGRRASTATVSGTGTTTSNSRRSSTTTSYNSDTTSSENMNGLGTEMNIALSRVAKKRLISGAYREDVSFRAFVLEIYRGFSRFIAIKGVLWGAAIVSMHHLGILALKIPQGRVIWNPVAIVFSCFVAWLVTCIAAICIRHMEVHFGRQMLFATVAASGVFFFHYSSVFLGATFVSSSPPQPNGSGYPASIPFTITALAILTCVLASGMLAQNATVARNRLAELILTKRRMWRVMAEKEAVDRASELKQSFISVASHELRTPLFSVTGYVELLARTQLTEEQDMYLANVQQACSNMALIISNVLDFSKLERNNAESTARPVRVNPRTMVESLTRMTEDRSLDRVGPAVDVIVTVSAEVPETVFLDEAYTVRVLINLISNALKFTERGFILIEALMRDGKMEVNVQDTGTGIPKRFRKLLFEPYRQADSSLTRPHQGTGLGLSICKQLVQRLDGEIKVASIEGQGTTFTVTLPVATPSEPPEPLVPSRPPRKRICLVRQNPRSEAFLRDRLTAAGYTVKSALGLSTKQLRESVDVIWADVETLAASTHLRALLRPARKAEDPSWPYFLVTTSPKTDVSLCEGLAQASNVIIVKTPGIVLHKVLAMLEDPWEHFAKDLPKGVRFNLPSSPRMTSSSSTASVSSMRGGTEPPGPSPDLVEMSLPSPTDAPTAPIILLVEDNKVNRLLGKRLLEKMGYEVETAEDGIQAIEVARKGRSKLILMDCQMPNLDGHGATRAIRELEAKGEMKGHIPIIALTAFVTPEAQRACEASGMTDFLPKPLKLADLKATIERTLGGAGGEL